NMRRYQDVSKQLFRLLDTLTPRVEHVSIDEAFLDLTGCPPPVGTQMSPDGTATPLEIGRAVKTRIGETLTLPVSVGVAPNKFLAKLASELAKPDGLREIRSEEAIQVLAPVPVTVLWGVGGQTRERLQTLGIRTVGDVQKTPASVLRAALGFAAEYLTLLSQGLDDRTVEVDRETKSIGRETTFDQDTADGEILHRTLGLLAEDVARTLRSDGLRGTTFPLNLRYSNFPPLTRALPPPMPPDSGVDVLRAGMRLFERLGALPRPVRLIGLSVSALGRADVRQGTLFGDDDTGERVNQVMDA